MPIFPEHIGRLRGYEEPNGSFGVDNTANLDSAFKDLPFVHGSLKFELKRPTESPAFTQQHLDRIPRDVLLPKRATVSFDMRLAALGNASAGQRPQSPLGLLLKIAMGSETRQTPTTVASAPSTTGFTATSAAGITKGCAIAVPTGAGGRLEAREVAQVSGNVVTLKHALSAAPSVGAVVYTSATYGMSFGTGEMVTSLQLSWKAFNGNGTDRWNFYGGQVSGVSLSLGPGQQPTVSFTWEFADWGYDDAAGDVAAATYSDTLPLVVADSELLVCLGGTTSITGRMVPATEIEFTPQIAYEPHIAPGGVNNIVQWVRVPSHPMIAGSFAYPFDYAETAVTWWTARDGGYTGSEYGVFYQIGSSAALAASGGGCVLLSAPSAQVVDVQRVPLGGIAGQRIAWKGSTDTRITSPSSFTPNHHSAFRIHLF